jgi:hypothetical protein
MIAKEDILIEIFCDAHDFWNEFFPIWKQVLIEHPEYQSNKPEFWVAPPHTLNIIRV